MFARARRDAVLPLPTFGRLQYHSRHAANGAQARDRTVPHRARGFSELWRVVAVAIVLCFAGTASAWADAADPVPAATTGSVVRNADGTYTLTVAGQWEWTTHTSDCSTNRAGVGYAIAWSDPTQPGNVVTDHALTVAVGTPTDNVAHPVPPNPHDVSTPAQFASWRGGCGTFNGTYNTGTWGPIAHTYPATNSGPYVICPIMYDVHGDNSTPSGSKESTAGGTGHNGDNSFEANDGTPLGNGCFTSTFIPEADLQVTKTADHDPVTPGGPLVYTIVTKNNGPTDADNSVMTDTLPSAVSFVATDDGVHCAAAGQLLTCNYGTIAAGGRRTVHVTVTVDASQTSTFRNTAVVSTTTSDTNPANNADGIDSHVTPQADVQVTKTADHDPVTAGGPPAYKIVTKKKGPSNARR